MAEENPKGRNYRYFERELQRLLGDVAYKNKFVVIHGEAIKGAYDDFDAALTFAVSNFPMEECIVQQVLAQEDQIDFLNSAVG